MEFSEHPPSMVALSLAVAIAAVGVLVFLDVLPFSLLRDLLVSGVVVTVAFAIAYRYWLSDVEGL